MVGFVHRDDVIEVVNICNGIELASALVGDVDAIDCCDLNRAGVRLVTDVPCTGAAGVDMKLVCKIILLNEVLEDAVCER